jgi:1-acyl-sn-glycerol-3-phosphate acyltransferase
MTLRTIRRAVALAFALAGCFFSYWFVRVRSRITMVQRAQWLHRSGARIISALGIRAAAHGRVPAHGMVVANHLSYLDIMIFSAVMPCFFVSKAEIVRWPYFGKAAQAGGTIFLDRRSRASTVEVARQIGERLHLPVPVLLFPEGTSTDGSRVLRFHSSLFEPAIAAAVPITPAAIQYVLHDGSCERDLCWFDDTLFLPHLWRVLGASGFSAEVTFGEPHTWPDRRTAADKTHHEVAAMRSQGELSAVSSQLSSQPT